MELPPGRLLDIYYLTGWHFILQFLHLPIIYFDFNCHYPRMHASTVTLTDAAVFSGASITALVIGAGGLAFGG
jgi:hypothetical protein